MKFKALLPLGALGALLASSIAQGAIIRFEGVGPVGTSVTGNFVESGFNLGVNGLYVDTGGNTGRELEPTYPSSSGSLIVTRVGGGLFTFAGIDIQREYGTGGAALQVRGYLGANLVGTDNYNATSGTYSTRAAGNLWGDFIDRLVITGERDSTEGVSFDNLVVNAVNAVPEPGVLALLGLGALGFLRRRRA